MSVMDALQISHIDREFDGDHSGVARFSIKSYARKTRFDAFCTVYGNGCTAGAPVRLPMRDKIISIENLMAIILA
uniref:Transposase n=1 Tax=Heterorhabditis bacteriophora TaxID=37862 RepID=A0A1I7WKU1_HETBA